MDSNSHSDIDSGSIHRTESRSISQDPIYDNSSHSGSDTDWMYDETLDDKDAQYVTHKKQHDSHTDAILSCPLCFTQICFVCQTHAKYEGQYRALSVEHCVTDRAKLYVYNRAGLLKPIHPGDDREMYNESDLYFLVACDVCGTSVGVMDNEGVYHLFHVLTDT